MFNRSKIYTVHEKLEVKEPSERIELVREGFSVWAFLFNLLWLLAHRLWIPFVGYLLLIVVVFETARILDINETGIGVIQVGLQFLIGVFGHDLQRWQLERRGYQLVGVVCAESEMLAELHAYDHHRTVAA